MWSQQQLSAFRTSSRNYSQFCRGATGQRHGCWRVYKTHSADESLQGVRRKCRSSAPMWTTFASSRRRWRKLGPLAERMPISSPYLVETGPVPVGTGTEFKILQILFLACSRPWFLAAVEWQPWSFVSCCTPLPGGFSIRGGCNRGWWSAISVGKGFSQ